jgi:hypothetical protein
MQIAANCMALIAETLKDSGLPLLLLQFFCELCDADCSNAQGLTPGQQQNHIHELCQESKRSAFELHETWATFFIHFWEAQNGRHQQEQAEASRNIHPSFSFHLSFSYFQL